ncbi:MAG: nucleotidyltransferase domain-containing protein [Bacteroidetes bacterium]|nr:nucleotidyltransferase domain-containing protein [Bacteroidota bacterium]
MRSDELIHIMKDYFRSLPVEKAWLFGSYARAEEDSKSDIDILIQFIKPNNIGLIAYFRIVHELEKLTGKKVDLAEEDQIRSYAESNVQKDKILIYERKASG